MKKAISILLLAGSLIVTGCGSSNDDYNQVSGQQGNPSPIITPTTTPTPPPATPGWFVEVGAGAGSYATGDAFGSIQDASNAAAAANNGDNTITVRAGTYTETVTLANNQRLLGTPGGNRPVLSGSITLADGNTVDFLRIQDSTDDAISGDGKNGGAITNSEIVAPGNDAISVEFAIGNWTISGNNISGAQTNGAGVVHTANNSISARFRVENNIFTNNEGAAVTFLNTDASQVTARIADNVMTGNFPGSTVEIIVSNSSTFGLDLEDNQNDDVYGLAISNSAATFQVEQLSVLTQPRPAGAGNTGTEDLLATGGASFTDIPEGTLGF